MRQAAIILTAFITLALSACAEGLAPSTPTASTPLAATRLSPTSPLILVSIDGFRWDYLDRGLTPNLSALAAGGVRAERMSPAFPSITFPNHYTLVTGLYPDHHGVVNNTFKDAHMAGVFHMNSKEPGWWGRGDPALGHRRAPRRADGHGVLARLGSRDQRRPPRQVGAVQPSQVQRAAGGYAPRLARRAGGSAAGIPHPLLRHRRYRWGTCMAPTRRR